MSEKQQKTLILFILHEALQRAVWDMRPSYEGAPTTPPERPHGGRWLASGVVFEAGEGRHSPYDRSGPVQVSYRAALEGEADCQMYDLQSCFGDAHWRYPQLSYPCSLQSVLRLYASTVSNRVTVDSTAVYDLIPELEQMYILRRDDTGKVRLNIPALTYDDHERLVIPAIERLREALLPLLEKDVQALWSASHYRVPKHVDACEWFKRFDALNAYTIAQMRAIVEQELLPYEVILGKTPLIYVVYRP